MLNDGFSGIEVGPRLSIELGCENIDYCHDALDDEVVVWEIFKEIDEILDEVCEPQEAKVDYIRIKVGARFSDLLWFDVK